MGMERAVVTAVGVDRRGIVAALAGVLTDLGCNLEDSTMSLLGGNFAVLLMVALPDGVGPAAVESGLAPVAEAMGLAVSVRAVPAGAERLTGSDVDTAGAVGDEDQAIYAFSVHGADRLGIVRHATEALAAAGGNILDLSTRLVGDAEDPVYVLTITAGFDAGAEVEPAVAGVRQAVERFGVQCRAHRVDIDVF
jgi:glycine cleavage system transcriptional repressor